MPLNEEWRKLATKQLKGADPEEKLTWHTAEVGSATCGETTEQRQYHCLVSVVWLQFQNGIEEKLLITHWRIHFSNMVDPIVFIFEICGVFVGICPYLLQKLLQLLVTSSLDYCSSSFLNIFCP